MNGTKKHSSILSREKARLESTVATISFIL